MLLRRKRQSVRYHGAERFLILAAVILFAACGEKRQPIRIAGKAQGSYYTVSYIDPQGRNLKPQVDSLLAGFDQSASLWVDSSLLRRVNAGLTDSLDPTLHDLLQHSTELFHYTQGAFNCCVGRIVQEWGFSFREQQEPDSARLQRLLQAAHAPVSLDGNRVLRTDPLTEFDFNAIAQGYSVDLLAAMFDSLGVENYIINVGGEVIARGDKYGHPWLAGIEKPAADSNDMPTVQTAIELHNASVVTSGSYRKYYERDGVRYSHTIDPATGRPVQHSLLSVSVVDSLCWRADAMATAYMVMGLDSALAFIAAHPEGPCTKAVMFIYDDHGTIKTYETEEFKKLTI